MSEPASEQQPEDSARQIDRQLLAESRLYGVAYQPYADMSPRERGALKARWANKLRAEARRRRIDPDEFLAMTEDAREEARKEHPEPNVVAVKRREAPAAAVSAAFEAVLRRHPPPADEEESEPPLPARPSRSQQPVADVYDEGLTEGDPQEEVVHSPMDEIPATEADPRMRTHPTIGEVRPTDNEDLVGWKQPKNLRDVYARFTIGDGQHFIRVERLEPRVWAQIPCSGYLGEIREAITESEFHQWYGGRVYALTVYGPDPKGRRDPATGLPIIKAKTDPFRYTVPVFPPNLAVLPGTNPTKQNQQKQGESQMNPFAPGFQQGAVPATPADAAMHRTNIDFMQNLLKRADEEKEELRKAALVSAAPNKDVLSIVSEASKQAVEQANRAAEKREESLREQLSLAREDARQMALKLERIAEQQQNQRTSQNPVQDAVHLVKEMHPGKNAEDEIVRLRQAHMEETNRIREQNRESAAALKERHDDELKRLRERLEDSEKHAREILEQTERRWRDRETELKGQVEQTRREERDVAERRVAETVARFDDRIKDMREQHARELRMQGEQHTTRVDTTKSTWDMQLANAKERIARLEEELSEAREEAEKSKDPVQVIGKITAQAEALGFTKTDENANQTAGERFVGTVGMGLSKAFETMNEWLPRAMEARAGGGQGQPGAPRQLPPAQGQGQPPQQQRIPRPQPRRTVAWASQGSVPVAGHQPTIPPETPFQPQQQPQQVQPMQPTTPMAPPPMQQVQPPPQNMSPMPAPQPQAPLQEHVPQNGQGTNALGAIFPDTAIVEFRAEVERAINVGLPAEIFAQRFVEAYPGPSGALVQMHKPEDLLSVVRGMPGGAESVILRRDGKRWVEKLWQQIASQHQARAAQPS